MNKICLVSVSLAFLSVCAPAHGQAAFDFGRQGQVAVSSDFALSVSTTSHSGGGSSTDVVLAPALDYFVIDNLSVGGQLSLTWSKNGDWHGTGFGLAPRVGYDVPFADQLSFWPHLALFYAGFSDSNDTSSTKIGVTVYAPLLLHPAQHFFIGLGPRVSTDLSSRASSHGLSGDGDKQTSIALTSTVGGWF
jgi:hypothetical protein